MSIVLNRYIQNLFQYFWENWNVNLRKKLDSNFVYKIVRNDFTKTGNRLDVL